MRVESVDIRFGKHCDRISGFVTITRTYVLESIQNLLVILVGLMSELVARKRQNGEFVSVRFREFVHCSEIFLRRTSQGRHIHYECLLDCVLVCV